MADTNTRASWDAFLFDMQGKVWEVFPSEAPFLAELSGFNKTTGMVDRASKVQRLTREMDGNRDIFSGEQVRHTIILAGLQQGGFVTETGTWNVPHALPSREVHIKLVRVLVPFQVTVDVERDSLNTSNANAVTTLIQQSRTAAARLENLAFLGDGTGLVAAVTSASGSPGLVVPVGTGANFDVLLPGTVWDILTRSTGANPGNGLSRLIASVDEAAGTVTFDTALQVTGGSSGNITFSANEGIYIPGSWSNSTGETAPGAKTAQGLAQVAAQTGTFEDLDKATVSQWRGTDGRAGDTSVIPLSDQMLQKGVRIGRRAGLGKWDFGLGDPAVIDLYILGKQSFVRYKEETTTLKSGFSGIAYDGADAPITLIKEPMMTKGTLRLIDLMSFQLYGDQPGPSFLEDDGAMFRRFARSLPKEADFLDRVQLGVTKCNTLVSFANLAVS